MQTFPENFNGKSESRVLPARKSSPIFYRQIFDLIHTRFSINYNVESANRIAREWKKRNPSREIGYYTQICMLGMKVWRVAAGEADEEVNQSLLTELEQLETIVDPKRYPLARFRLTRVWAAFLAQIYFDIPRRAAFLDEGVTLCREHPDLLPEHELVSTLLIRAEHEYFFGDDHREAWKMYSDLFKTYPNTLDEQSYHRTKYLQLCLILDMHKIVEDMLTQYESTYINAKDVGQAKGAALLWAKLMLYKGELDKARHFIDRAFELNQKRFYVQYEIECRLLQTTWLALKGDSLGVEQLAPAHMKYLRSKGYYLKTSTFYPWFFKLALAFIDEQTTGKPLSRNLSKKYEEFQKGAAAQYGKLLQRMRQIV